ncbi:putative uncharacterized protein DDB_G0282129 [Sitodiplosis mosellana]|uniref:putative uncharacterized protein DDB_G0282129 n=1 Tax=Sitodiplosis mosellana TaxID=263140 RepID=UPI0024446DCE|nr:putative uncharacterized protein DDB_G0282129 [Sitodiplosis mosellana]
MQRTPPPKKNDNKKQSDSGYLSHFSDLDKNLKTIEDRTVHDLTTGRRSLIFSVPESSSTFIFNRNPVQENLNETWLDGAAGLEAQSQFLDPNRITQSHHGGSVVDHYHFDPFEAAEETYSVLKDKSVGNLSVEREKTDGKSDDQLVELASKEPTEADKTTDTANGNSGNATDSTANNLIQSQQPPNNNNNNDRNNDASNPENGRNNNNNNNNNRNNHFNSSDSEQEGDEIVGVIK